MALPAPSTLSAQMRPPWASIRLRVMDRPNQVGLLLAGQREAAGAVIRRQRRHPGVKAGLLEILIHGIHDAWFVVDNQGFHL
jgi:hypothetical protein